MRCPTGYRLIKWLGDPPALREDGWRVANWRYENRRLIAMPKLTRRYLHAASCTRDPTANPPVIPIPGLSQTYAFDAKQFPNFIVPVKEADAKIILAMGQEFVDVTGMPNPENVRNAPVIVPRRSASSVRAASGGGSMRGRGGIG
jgi:hypothetical protein